MLTSGGGLSELQLIRARARQIKDALLANLEPREPQLVLTPRRYSAATTRHGGQQLRDRSWNDAMVSS